MLRILPIHEETLPQLWKLGFTQTQPEWKKWDAPYFDDYRPLTYAEFEQLSFFHSENVRGIYVNGQIIGIVSRYWEDKSTRWLNVGIVIYDSQHWGNHYGTQALIQWVSDTFMQIEDIQRVGLVTWSGNHRMMKVAQKLAMTLEGQLRKVRYYNGVYYDSMQYGILREEWEQLPLYHG